MTAVRIRLDGGDLVRVRLAASLDPILEALAAVHRMPILRLDPAFMAWAKGTMSGLGAAGPPLMGVLNSDFLQVSGLTLAQPPFEYQSFDDALEAFQSIPRSGWRSEVQTLAGVGVAPGVASAFTDGDRGTRRLAEIIRRFHRVALSPYWRQLVSNAIVGRQAWADLLACKGVDTFLATVHTQVEWHPPILTVRLHGSCPARCIHHGLDDRFLLTTEIAAGGRGLVIERGPARQPGRGPLIPPSQGRRTRLHEF